MFLREKKVGKAAYVQLVQSTRTAKGPRSKVVASLGRADDPKTRDTLKRLAERSAELSGVHYPSEPSIAPIFTQEGDGSSPEDSGIASVEQIVPGALQQQIIHRALLKSGLSGHADRLFGPDEMNDDFAPLQDATRAAVVASAVAGATFNRMELLSKVVFDHFPAVPSLPSAVATVLSRGNSEDEELIVHIGRPRTGVDGPNLFGQTVFAIAVNGKGRLLMAVHWPDFANLMDMIALHVQNLLFAMPGRRLTLCIDPVIYGPDRSPAIKRTVMAIHASGVQFITPLKEMSTLLEAVPDQILEQRLEVSSLEDAKDMRYLRMDDTGCALRVQAGRQFMADRLEGFESTNEKDMMRRDLLLKRTQEAGEGDGSTLLMTNSRQDRTKVVHAYVMALQARRFLDQLGLLGSRILQHPNLPRESAPLVDRLITLALLGRAALADALERGHVTDHTLHAIADCNPVQIVGTDKGAQTVLPEGGVCAAICAQLDINSHDLPRQRSAPVISTQLP